MRNLSQPLQNRWNPAILDRNRLFYALWSTFLFLIIIWGVFWCNELFEMNWRRYGNHPRVWSDWSGVFTFPFLHSDFEHLWNNTATFFTLNGFLFYFYRSIALRVWIGLFILSGTGLWLFAEIGKNHIGASGLIYALAAFLFVSGVIRKSQLLLRVSLVVAFLYGGMVWWMLPVDAQISWEGHLSGAISGVIGAFLMRSKGPLPDLKLFTEEDYDAPLPAWWAEAHPNHPDVIAQQSTRNSPTSESGEIEVDYTIIPNSAQKPQEPKT